MAQEIKAEKFQTTVVFDASKIAAGGNPFSFSGDGASEGGEDFTIPVKTPLALIGLDVKTFNGDGFAVFTTSSIQWLDSEGFPISTPAPLFVQRSNPLQLTLVSVNRARVADERFNMEIGVVYKGRTYTSPDPTIINVAEPPGGGLDAGEISGLDVTQASVMSTQVS
jgi:hypothetical protein